MAESKEEYVQRLKKKVNEFKEDLENLAQEMEGSEDIGEYQEGLEELRDNLRELEEKVAEMQSFGDSAWEDIKQGVEKSWSTWKNSFARAKSQFEKGYKEARKK